MPRLTRAERQAQTRADLLQAAKARFLAKGYAATSLEDIAEDAGYSKGAIYSNFSDKPSLCREVLEEVHREKFTEMDEIALADASLEDRLSMFGEWADRTIGDVGWTMLELEFLVLSRHDPELGRMAVELRAGMTRMVLAALRPTLERLGVPVEGEQMEELVAELADLLLQAGIGLGIQRAVDPAVAARRVSERLKEFVTLASAQLGTAGEKIKDRLAESGSTG